MSEADGARGQVLEVGMRRWTPLNKSPLLSIIFINYNSTPELVYALQSLEVNRPEFRFEAIVVDNSPVRDFELRVADFAFPLLTIVNRENRGYGAAANQGIRIAQGEYVAIANPDIVFLPNTLDRLVRFLHTHAEAGIVAPQFLWPDMTPQPSARRYPRLGYIFSGRRSVLNRLLPNRSSAREFLYAGIEDQTEPVEVETAIGAFLVAPRSLMLALKGFDEGYFMFVEDVDLCRRIAQLGKKVFILPAARLVHTGGVSRRRASAAADFVRLRSFLHYFRREYPRLPATVLLFLFSAYWALLAVGRVVGLREPEYAVHAARETG